MSSRSEREKLTQRQGAGARYDAADAPADHLLLARRGTAYFLRLLNGLLDEDLVDNRATVIARISYEARGFARLIHSAHHGTVVKEHETAQGLAAEIARASSLPARALRGLFAHSAIHLDVEWRDLPNRAWDRSLTRYDGSIVTARETPMLRARAIWQAALDLDAGGRLRDVPASLRGEAGFK